MGWRVAADLVVVVHLAFVAFVVLGGVFVLRRRWIAFVHLPVVAYGVLIEVIGFTCPLTPFEKQLRGRAGATGYEGSFVEHYLVPVLYPGELTPRVELALAGLLVTVNVAVYLGVRRSARRPPAPVGHC